MPNIFDKIDLFFRIHPDFLKELKKNKPLLKKVLAGHVIPGSWYTAGLFTGDKLKNWNGDFITVDKNQNGEIRFKTNSKTYIGVGAMD